jgi:DNA-binding sugar fermentation-stimulating protein
VEVKNVPLSHYRNDVKGCADYRAAAAQAVPAGLGTRDKIALFPDGYRKKKEDAVSPRATKHLDNLAELVGTGDGRTKSDPGSAQQSDRAYCVFLCQRVDAVRFEPAALDGNYTSAFKAAVQAGVQVRCYVAAWTEGFAAANYYGELPVVMP